MSEKKATRQAYGEALAELSDKYDFAVLDADLAAATKTGIFKKKCPERFIDCGIAEANMMGVAAGLAAVGETVFASSFAMFAAGRAFEIVRNSIGYPHLNVKIGATHAGISVGEDGATHQCNEDIALMRTIPGMTIINPADEIETKAAVEAALGVDGPVYLRLGRLAVPNVNSEGYKFELGKGVELKSGGDVSIIATGLAVAEALAAANELEKDGVSARVINIYTIKPLDTEIILKAARETRRIVTVEEHSVIGGLGAAVAETLCMGCPCSVSMIGIPDVYGYSGKAEELMREFGISSENIEAKVKEALR